MKTVTPEQVLSLIKRLPDADLHIHREYEGMVSVTNEWLVGGFAGRGFPTKSEEESAQQLIEYLNRHIGHNSMVGRVVRLSGWPDLERVEKYCIQSIEEESEL